MTLIFICRKIPVTQIHGYILWIFLTFGKFRKLLCVLHCISPHIMLKELYIFENSTRWYVYKLQDQYNLIAMKKGSFKMHFLFQSTYTISTHKLILLGNIWFFWVHSKDQNVVFDLVFILPEISEMKRVEKWEWKLLLNQFFLNFLPI